LGNFFFSKKVIFLIFLAKNPWREPTASKVGSKNENFLVV